MKTKPTPQAPPLSPEELTAKIDLLRVFLRNALLVSGGTKTSPAATRVAGEEAARLKTEIQHLEQQLPHKAAA